MAIIIVGLGPGNPDHLTCEAHRVLLSARIVHLPTRRHPCVEYLERRGVHVESFEDAYESLGSLHDVHAEISRRLIAIQERHRQEDVMYAVPGNPGVGETTTRLMCEWGKSTGQEIRVVSGMSTVEPVISLLNLDALDGLQVVDGTELVLLPHPWLNVDRSVIIAPLHNAQMKEDVKLRLGDVYPEGHEGMAVRMAGTPQVTIQYFSLCELDRRPDIDDLSCIYLPPVAGFGSWLGLQTIVARLRGPDGCPWDRQQSHRSLRTHLLDETYEVLDALDRGDVEALKTELGDLALQIALHIQIAIEEGEFRPGDVFGHIIAKLRRRHPHVFGTVQVNGADEVMVNWEQIKRQEKGASDLSHQLEGVPGNLPALAQALTYQERAVRVGYEPENGNRLHELVEDWLARAKDVSVNASDEEHSLGELLFNLVDMARRRGINPESALREANARFARMFMENYRGPTGEQMR